MIERIQQLMKAFTLSAADLADALGTERSGISHFLSGRNKPSLAFIIKLLEKFPDISPDWLVLGTGPMMRNDAAQIKQNAPIPVQAETIISEPAPVQTNVPVDTSPAAKDEDPVEYKIPVRSKPVEKTLPNAEKDNDSPSQLTQTERIVIFYNDHTFSEYTKR